MKKGAKLALVITLSVVLAGLLTWLIIYLVGRAQKEEDPESNPKDPDDPEPSPDPPRGSVEVFRPGGGRGPQGSILTLKHIRIEEPGLLVVQPSQDLTFRPRAPYLVVAGGAEPYMYIEREGIVTSIPQVRSPSEEVTIESRDRTLIINGEAYFINAEGAQRMIVTMLEGRATLDLVVSATS